MSARRIRLYADLFPGIEDRYIAFMQNPSRRPPDGMKRVFIEVELPDDIELWPEVFSGERAGTYKATAEKTVIDSSENEG